MQEQHLTLCYAPILLHSNYRPAECRDTGIVRGRRTLYCADSATCGRKLIFLGIFETGRPTTAILVGTMEAKKPLVTAETTITFGHTSRALSARGNSRNDNEEKAAEAGDDTSCYRKRVRSSSRLSRRKHKISCSVFSQTLFNPGTMRLEIRHSDRRRRIR